MKGVEALAAAIIAGTDRQYTVPGFPVTDLGALTRAGLVINEKTALEYALGDSLAGRRAAVIVKNVGVNACADPLLQATVQGIRGGVLLVVGDDPGAKGSQTAQDSRYYGEMAEIPVIEPDETSCFTGVEAALTASETFSRVAMLRLIPQLLDAEVVGEPVSRNNGQGKLADPALTMHGRVTAATGVYRTVFAWSDTSSLNRWKGGTLGVGPAPGDSRVATVNPVPSRAGSFTEIHEFGRSFVRDHRAVTPPGLQGQPESRKNRGFSRTFCAACPYRPLLDLLKERKMQLICDAGCSVFALNPPYELGIASYGMGASIAVAARSTHVALIGDYALLHSGINALIDVYEKGLPLLCIVMKNHCAAMTGGQRVSDPLPYLRWADPIVCPARDEQVLREVIRDPEGPCTVIVEAECPKGAYHETVEC
ncbi:thiamine pyrophosphate-dependent enzyme [Methanoregula sp.]|uniref:thiamine pyrophosphate-dependent enzyme n=1 Tax=Methanoregula sp. TaxID=2052170 RepID=UPI002C5E9EC7|nr:thiamine pyrophosphate-dependent enzyme [Methanoregula sp.]HVP97490.1 thiamine pyrophosphate-dependent enzyme [Methanoregula sp.]